MSKMFSELKTNVGNMVQDTTSTFSPVIGVFLNNRYRDILKRADFKVIDHDYSISVVAGTKDYTLPTNFGKELYAQDSTNLDQLSYIELQEWLDKYSSNPTDTGTPEVYTIFDTFDSNTRAKTLRLYPIPSAGMTLNLPYQINSFTLTDPTDIPCIDCDDIIEVGATADAWRYKRQFAKAADLEQLYERMITQFIFDKNRSLNRVPLFNPQPYSRETV